MQAARGTAVGHEESGPDRPGPRLLTHPPTWVLFALVGGFWYAADQVSKYLAVRHLTHGADVEFLGEVLQFHLTRNPGAAFSLGTDFTVAISMLALVASVVVVWLSRGLADRTWAVALGLVLAGILGNFTDRLFQAPGPFRGEVIDFLMLPNWPVFNIADICINVGVGLVLLQSFRGIGMDGGRDGDSTPTDRPDEGA